jgi:hypothetical protein
MSFAIANSFLLNSPMDASGFYYLIPFQGAYGFSLLLSIKPLFLSIIPLFRAGNPLGL